MNKLFKLSALTGTIIILSACSTWNNMDRQEKRMVEGGAVGAVAGAWLSEGEVLGTIGGAAVGGLIGNEIGKPRDKK